MRTKYKQWAVDYLDEHPELVVRDLDLSDDFFKKPISIEIGPGKGEFILGKANANPDINFLAVEKNRTIAGQMSKMLVESGVKNVRVCPLDFSKVCEVFPKEFFENIYLNFVDPWPKKKHAKRRLTFIAFLNKYYEMLKSGGRIYFKSDNDILYEFTLEELAKTKFIVEENLPDYKFDEANDVMTGYETKFRGLGQPIHRIVVRK